jgi:hypothetical protein
MGTVVGVMLKTLMPFRDRFGDAPGTRRKGSAAQVAAAPRSWSLWLLRLSAITHEVAHHQMPRRTQRRQR